MGKKYHTLAWSILLGSTHCSFPSPKLHVKHHQHVLQVSEPALTSGTSPNSDARVGTALGPNPNPAGTLSQRQAMVCRGNPLPHNIRLTTMHQQSRQKLCFFCLTNHHAFVKFVFNPFYPTLLFLFPREWETGSTLIFIIILLTSPQHQRKRLGISLNFGLFLHTSCRVLSRNREEGDLKRCQEYSKEMRLPSSQLCSRFWEAHGRMDAHCHRRGAEQKGTSELPRSSFCCQNSRVQKASQRTGAIKPPTNHLSS